MRELFLPDTICSPIEMEKSVFAMPYVSNQNSLKTRIILNRHLFSFFIEGEKIVSYASGTISDRMGTSFEVKSFNNERSASVTVSTGKVGVLPARNHINNVGAGPIDYQLFKSFRSRLFLLKKVTNDAGKL